MARRAGKVSALKLEDSASTAREISSRVLSVTMNRSVEEIDVTGLNTNFRDRIAGFSNWGLDISGIYDDSAASALGTDELLSSQLGHIITASVFFSGSGQTTYTGSGLVTAYNTNATPDGVVGFTSTLVGIGAYARG